MKNFIHGLMIGIVDLILIISGITCFIIARAMAGSINGNEVEVLLIIGLIGIGIGIGTLLTIVSFCLLSNS